MIVIGSIAEIQALIYKNKLSGKKIAFVPTMGALHSGHIKLVESAKKDADIVVSSIYVNPTQFNNADDLKTYPRNTQKDIDLLKKNGCDILFTPSDEMMYAKPHTLSFDFGRLGKVMEGEFRPGHFSGVALVVSKLFHIVQPHIAFFGQKDLQQLAIIRKLVDELLFDIEIIGVPIMREADGLAMSSRNGRLTEIERQEATIFYHSLLKAKKLLLNKESFGSVLKHIQDDFADHSASLEYLSIVSDQDLEAKSENYLQPDTVLCIAGYIGNVRLIDNMYLIS